MIARLHNNKANKVASTSAFVECFSPCSRPSSTRRHRAGPQINRRRRATLLKLAKYTPVAQTIPTTVTMQSATTRVTFSAHLDRPTFGEVDVEALRKACPELGDSPLPYVREGLKVVSSHMYAGVQSAVPKLTTSHLPHELQVMLSDPISHGSICPTHILAITSSTIPRAGTPLKYTLFPTHQLVLGANCSRLPAFPSSATAVPLDSSSNEVTMPVVRLALPAPEQFSALMWYIYSKDSQALRKHLLPSNWSSDIARIMRQVRFVQGIWANACALGVVDLPLFDALEESWQQIHRQLARVATPSS